MSRTYQHPALRSNRMEAEAPGPHHLLDVMLRHEMTRDEGDAEPLFPVLVVEDGFDPVDPAAAPDLVELAGPLFSLSGLANHLT